MTIREIIAKTCAVPLDQILADSCMGQVPGWDSIGHLSILAELSHHFGKEVPFDMITELTDVKALEVFFSST
jgi:acyl carrier protein